MENGGGRCPHLICNAAHMNGGFAALSIILHYNTTKSKGLNTILRWGFGQSYCFIITH